MIIEEVETDVSKHVGIAEADGLERALESIEVIEIDGLGHAPKLVEVPKVVGASAWASPKPFTQSCAATKEVGTFEQVVDASAIEVLPEASLMGSGLQLEHACVPPPLVASDLSSLAEEVVVRSEPPGMEGAAGWSMPLSMPTFGVASRSVVTSFVQV
ncbi:hypothetical protein Nepgr_008130 [Nepenthes gracilis]|uniref:Uncharacterized protein n=1 Tax=Nepenthes gracilis TaxID=150966 RepID=A0AAD3S876_NEPGR|nr:hypothetical protein Nepgr_008130 [Nepenthes gracilis]